MISNNRRNMMNSIMMGRLARLTLAVVALVMTVGAVRAEAWWDEKWQHRRKVALDTTANGAEIKEAVTEVPVLVRLHTGNFSFTNAKEDGSDVRFVAGDDKTPLKFHFEMYDPKKEIALAWVKVPQLAANSGQNMVWVYYGNSGVQAAQDAGGTYDTPQALVYHFSETQGAPQDSSSYKNHAKEFTGGLGAPALIGGGAVFKGAERIVVPASPSLAFPKGFTFSIWVKPAQIQGETHLFSWGDGAQGIVVGLEQGGGAFARVGQAVTGRTQPLTPQEWHHLAVSAEPGKRLTIYLNGREAASVAMAAAMPAPAGEAAIGGGAQGGQFFVGEMDEVTLAGVARPAAWFAAAAGSQGQEGKLVALAQEEEGGKGEADLTIHLMKVIAKSITLDGWAIIGLCTFMLFFAAAVFVFKFLALQKIIKGNETFLESFDELHDPLALEDADEDLKHSSMYRIYRAGKTEIERWLARQSEEKEITGLTPSALNIFRTALDKANVKEKQNLSSWLIVMTLGISGGPFWGLLGTVWGVMNTFASLAESGEANLSAIAPGVASALACTLFGLFVAIPALFAYSYLTNRMKNLNADTHIFIDEFAVKVEGAYGEKA
ncbi:MAG: DUF2341 domain-containing protein [Desulfuromonadales bacterium]|nr:MAG: DUF2341 domain-containing protein [Desulfuromonadales bacterium]